MPSERERLIVAINDELYSSHGEHCSRSIECDCSADFCSKRLADFILADRKRILDEIDQYLREPEIAFRVRNNNARAKIAEALSVIKKERK